MFANWYENKSGRLSSAELYTPDTKKFISAGNMNYARKKPNLILLKDGRVLISGGYNTKCVNRIEVYNPIKNIFTLYNSAITRACTTTATLLKNDKVLFVGGRKFRHNSRGTSNILNIKTRNIEPGPETKIPHAGHASTLLKDGRVLITGGKKEWGAETRAEIYNYKEKE